LHMRYYKDYGLAIEGLVRHHKVDALEYNEKVDDALPLEDIMSPDPKLRKLLKDLDTSKVKPWLFTNAYINHGRRVVKLLGIEDMFEGITYCDYSAARFLCKPSPDMFKKAMAEAGVTSPEDCYFVGTLQLRDSLRTPTDTDYRRLCYQRSRCDQDGLDCRPFGRIGCDCTLG
jgi:pyrimidine and pyridine-specific 5'-nucleotidase